MFTAGLPEPFLLYFKYCFQERKRNLDDEKKIREKEVEAKNLQQVIAKLRENAAVFNINTLVDEKSNLNETAVRMQHRVSYWLSSYFV